MYKLFLCLRYLHKRRIAFFAVGAVCLCVAMVLIVISVMGGFLNMVRDRSRGMLGDLIVESDTLQGFPFYDEFIQRLKTEMPGEIEEATPVIITYGVLRFPQTSITKAVQVVGIKLEETYRVNDFKNGLFYEKHYPGTTSFAAQQEPYLGRLPDGNTGLPPELEEARGKWAAKAGREEIDEAWRKPYWVFSFGAGELSRSLDGRVVSPELRQELQNGWPLPENLKVDVVEKGEKWVLRGPEEEVCTLERYEDRLRVFYKFYKGPGYYLDPPGFLRAPPGWQGKALRGTILGTDLCADRLKTGGYDRFCHRGEMVQISLVPFSDMGVIETGTGMRSLLMRYADDCRTGVYDIDSTSVYVDFDQLQDTVNMTAYVREDPSEEATRPAGETRPSGPEVPARTTQVQIKLNPKIDDHAKVTAARDRVKQIWSQVRTERIEALRDAPEVLERVEGPARRVKVQTWEEKQARYIGAVEKEKILVTTIFGVVSVVAVILVGVIFYMIVQQKTRDIGIVKSVGATSWGVAGIFLTYGAAVGIVGGALGAVLGTVFVWHINRIQDFLIWISPSAQVWNPEVYAFDHIPNEVAFWDVFWIYAAAILASVAGSLIAAWKASKVWPVEALRYE